MGSNHFEYDRILYYRFDGERKEKIIQKLVGLLVAEDRIKIAYIFGSFARRNNVRDIDLAIYSAPRLSFGEVLKFGSRIELELGIPVDLVQLQDLSPAFRYKVLRHGLLVVTKDVTTQVQSSGVHGSKLENDALRPV